MMCRISASICHRPRIRFRFHGRPPADIPRTLLRTRLWGQKPDSGTLHFLFFNGCFLALNRPTFLVASPVASRAALGSQAVGGEFNAALVGPFNSTEWRNLAAGMERQHGRSEAVAEFGRESGQSSIIRSLAFTPTALATRKSA